MLTRLARLAAAAPRRVAGAGLLLLVVFAVVGGPALGKLNAPRAFDDPGSAYLTGTYHSVAWAETSQHAPFILATHAGLGLLLVAGSLWLSARAVRGPRRAVTWAAALGALCIIGAALNGASFLDYNNNANSYLMALLFAAAVLCYSLILALAPATPNTQRPDAPHPPATRSQRSPRSRPSDSAVRPSNGPAANGDPEHPVRRGINTNAEVPALSARPAWKETSISEAGSPAAVVTRPPADALTRETLAPGSWWWSGGS